MFGPYLVEANATAPENRGGPDEAVGMEAGRHHEDIELMQCAIFCSDSAGFYAFDGGGHDFRIRMLNRLVKIRREDQPFAGGPIVRPLFFA